MNIRTKIYVIFIISGAVLIFRNWGNVIDFTKNIYTKTSVISSVFAEDEEDEDERDEENDEDDDESVRVIDTKSGGTAKKTETITTYVKLSDTVSKQTETIIKYDSDGDGVFDEEDPNPTINEFYIVKDDNLNGIVDSYE